MFDGRVRIDATYYYQKTTKNIVRLDIANSTGYFYERKNAGVISNQGLELLVGVTPVRTKNFRWDLDVNFATNRQRVDELHPSIDSYNLASGYNSCQIKAKKGEAFSMYGTYWLDNDDGEFIINPETGMRVMSHRHEEPRQGRSRLDDGYRQHAFVQGSFAEFPARLPRGRRDVLGYGVRPARHGRGEETASGDATSSWTRV